jgi:hypothetical protein
LLDDPNDGRDGAGVAGINKALHGAPAVQDRGVVTVTHAAADEGEASPGHLAGDEHRDLARAAQRLRPALGEQGIDGRIEMPGRQFEDATNSDPARRGGRRQRQEASALGVGGRLIGRHLEGCSGRRRQCSRPLRRPHACAEGPHLGGA